jgi:hypothetical protein
MFVFVGVVGGGLSDCTDTQWCRAIGDCSLVYSSHQQGHGEADTRRKGGEEKLDMYTPRIQPD